MTDHQIEKLIDQAAKSTKPIARVVRLDSAMATELLARAATNRDVRRTRVARYRADMEGEARTLTIQPLEIDDLVMHIGGRDMRIGNDGMAAIHRAMVEIEEALRLAVPHHVATLGIRA